MTQKTSPFIEAKFGWDFGESNWNMGMDENLLKFSYLHDSNINGIVTTLPAPVTGEAYFRTTDKRVHFVADGAFKSTPIPKWHELTIKSNGKKYSYNGTTLVPEPTANQTVVNIKDYGAVGDGVTDDLAAFQEALLYMRVTLKGGRLVIPQGVYKISKPLKLYGTATTGLHDITIEGSGSGTVLDFSSPHAESDGDGLKFYGYAGRFSLSDLVVRGATRHGININADITIGDMTKWIHSFSVRNVFVQNCGMDGIIMAQTYMGTFDSVGCWNNGRSGFRMLGFHTSMNFNTCWATQDTYTPTSGAGWHINGITYSNFTGCGADNNGGSGWRFSNVLGITLNGCGSEGNGSSGFSFLTSSSVGLPAIARGIKGVKLSGCYSQFNSTEAVGLHACHLSVLTAGTETARIVMEANTSLRRSGGDLSLSLCGDGGQISLVDELNSMDGGTYKRNSVYITNSAMVGSSAVVRLVTGTHRSTPTGVEVALPLFETVSNLMGAVLTNGGVEIPKGVNRVKITAGVDWASNSNGYRTVRVFKTNTVTTPHAGAASSVVLAITGLQQQNISSAIFEVSEGDFFGVATSQTSGGNLDARSSPYTFMSVEVMG